MSNRNRRPDAPTPINYDELIRQSGEQAENQIRLQAQAQQDSYRAMLDDAMRATGQIAGYLENDYASRARGMVGGVSGDIAAARALAGQSNQYASMIRNTAQGVGTAAQYVNRDAAGVRQVAGALNPLISQTQGVASQMGNLANRATANLGGTQIERMLQSQAQNELALGGRLSAEEQRVAEQSARSAYAARGMATGNPAASAEILNRDAYSRARQNERRTFAAGTNQLLEQNYQGRIGMAGQLRQGQGQMIGQAAGIRQGQGQLLNAAGGLAATAGQLYQGQGAMYGQAGSLSNAAGQLRLGAGQMGLAQGQAYLGIDPFARALGSNLPANAMQGSLSMAGMAGNAVQSNQQLAGQVAGFNQNMQGSMYNSWMNNQAGIAGGQMQANAMAGASRDNMTGQLMSTLGTGAAAAGTAAAGAIAAGAGATAVGGGAAAAAASAAVAGAVCWVAREAFGEQDVRWRVFRSWLLRRSPEWFLRAYARHGERVAGWLRAHAWAKPAVRFCMERAMA